MYNEPIHTINYQCHISTEDIKNILKLFFNSGTNMKVSFCIYQQDFPCEVMFISLTSTRPSFCSTLSDHQNIKVDIGTFGAQFISFDRNDLEQTVNNVKKAILAALEDPAIQKIRAKFKYPFEVVFDNADDEDHQMALV